jgi:hypothetical protein
MNERAASDVLLLRAFETTGFRPLVGRGPRLGQPQRAAGRGH